MPVKIVLKFLSLRWLLNYNYNDLYEQGRGRGGRDWGLSSEEKCAWRLGRVYILLRGGGSVAVVG